MFNNVLLNSLSLHTQSHIKFCFLTMMILHAAVLKNSNFHAHTSSGMYQTPCSLIHSAPHVVYSAWYWKPPYSWRSAFSFQTILSILGTPIEDCAYCYYRFDTLRKLHAKSNLRWILFALIITKSHFWLTIITQYFQQQLVQKASVFLSFG